MKKCAEVHCKHLKVDGFLKPYEGDLEKLPLMYEFLSGDRNVISTGSMLGDLDSGKLTIQLFQVIRHVLMILMQMLDSEEKDDSEFRTNFPLYTFEIPEVIKI